MNIANRMYRKYNIPKAQKQKYDDYSDEDDYYYEHKPKATSKEKKSKYRYKTIESNYEDNNTKKWSITARQKTIWGSKANQTNKFSYKNRYYSEKYSETSFNSKIERKSMKKIRKILKCLIEFKKSRREIEGKYFDIWYDKTFNDYDSSYRDDYKKKKNYNSKKHKYESKEKKLYKKIDSFKKNENSKNKGKNNLKRKKSDKEEFFDNDTNSSNKDIYYLTFNDMKYHHNKNKSKNNLFVNNDKEYSKSRKVNFKNSNDYFSDEFGNEKKSKFNHNSKSKGKKKKVFNKKLLFILNKYLIEKKEVSQCFNKWLDVVDSVYVYNDEKLYKEEDNKAYYNNKDYNKYNNNKYQIKKNNEIDSYKIEKYYNNYEEIPKKANSREKRAIKNNNLYVYNEKDEKTKHIKVKLDNNLNNNLNNNNYNYNKYRSDIIDLNKINTRTSEGHKRIPTFNSNQLNNESELNTNKYNDYDTTTITNQFDTEEKITNSKNNKFKSLNVLDDKIFKDAKIQLLNKKDKPEKVTIIRRKEIKVELLPESCNGRVVRTRILNKENIKNNDFEEFIAPSSDKNLKININKDMSRINNYENKQKIIIINNNNNYKSNNQNINYKNSNNKNIEQNHNYNNINDKSNNQKIYINNDNDISNNQKNNYNNNEDKEKEFEKNRKKILTNLFNKSKYKNINLINCLYKWNRIAFDTYDYSDNTDRVLSSRNKTIKKDKNSEIFNLKSNSIENENLSYIKSKHKKTQKEKHDTKNIIKDIKEKDYFIMNFIEPSVSENDNNNNNNNNNQQSLGIENKKHISNKNISLNINKQSSTSENNDENDIKVETNNSIKDKEAISKIFTSMSGHEEKNKNIISSTSNLEESSINKKPEQIIINLENEFKKSSSFDPEKNNNKEKDEMGESNNLKENKKKKKASVDLEKLSKKERRRYKKLKKGMHLLRKVIRSFKKKKKKGLIKIDDTELLRKYFNKWYNNISSDNNKEKNKTNVFIRKKEISEPKKNKTTKESI